MKRRTASSSLLMYERVVMSRSVTTGTVFNLDQILGEGQRPGRSQAGGNQLDILGGIQPGPPQDHPRDQIRARAERGDADPFAFKFLDR
jgi:hypothetical protein